MLSISLIFGACGYYVRATYRFTCWISMDNAIRIDDTKLSIDYRFLFPSFSLTNRCNAYQHVWIIGFRRWKVDWSHKLDRYYTCCSWRRRILFQLLGDIQREGERSFEAVLERGRTESSRASSTRPLCSRYSRIFLSEILESAPVIINYINRINFFSSVNWIFTSYTEKCNEQKLSFSSTAINLKLYIKINLNALRTPLRSLNFWTLWKKVYHAFFTF